MLEQWLVLGLVAALSPSVKRRIEAHFGDPEAAAEAGLEGWKRAGLLRRREGRGTLRAAPEEPTPELLSYLKDTARWAEGQRAEARRRGVKVLCWGRPGYPPLLGVAPDPPPVIYVRGDPGHLDRPAVAVVGARRATRYGAGVARRLAAGLTRSGLAVVSGGARGIDSEAHRGALESGGPTIAVMGCGLDVVYPPENAGLYGMIAGSGLLVSEFPFGVAPRPHHFPQRNRVIAGLSLAVVVVEGREGSGSLITVARALDADREVMAVPGNVTSALSDGPNRLLAEGARMVRSTKDVLEGLPDWVKAGVTGDPDEASGEERAVPAGCGPLLELLDASEGRTADEIDEALRLGPSELLGRLTALELEGWIEQMPGGRYARRK